MTILRGVWRFIDRNKNRKIDYAGWINGPRNTLNSPQVEQRLRLGLSGFRANGDKSKARTFWETLKNA